MILLYHGGTDKVARPVCKFGRPYLDFGPGFYLTDIRQQAVDWAKRQAVDGRLNPMLNVYSFNPNRSLGFGQIARLCHAACFSPSRRRSGLRRGVARIRMRTEAGKMPESLTFPIKNGLGVSNDRFGFKQEEAIVRYRYLRFEAYDEAWLDFIVDCRQGRDVWLDYDIVEGGVANDRVIDTVELYTLGFLGKSEALGRLSEHQPNNRICILSQEVIEEYLEFLSAEEL